MSGMCVAPHLSSTEWDRLWTVAHTLCPETAQLTFCDSCHRHGRRYSLESIANEILNCFNDFCIISNQLFLLPNFPQKRAKKLEGETLYIRHSNLMLEVCIFRYLFWLLAVTFLCLHASCVDVPFFFNTTVSLF